MLPLKAQRGKSLLTLPATSVAVFFRLRQHYYASVLVFAWLSTIWIWISQNHLPCPCPHLHPHHPCTHLYTHASTCLCICVQRPELISGVNLSSITCYLIFKQYCYFVYYFQCECRMCVWCVNAFMCGCQGMTVKLILYFSLCTGSRDWTLVLQIVWQALYWLTTSPALWVFFHRYLFRVPRFQHRDVSSTTPVKFQLPSDTRLLGKDCLCMVSKSPFCIFLVCVSHRSMRSIRKAWRLWHLLGVFPPSCTCSQQANFLPAGLQGGWFHSGFPPPPFSVDKDLCLSALPSSFFPPGLWKICPQPPN